MTTPGAYLTQNPKLATHMCATVCRTHAVASSTQQVIRLLDNKEAGAEYFVNVQSGRRMWGRPTYLGSDTQVAVFEVPKGSDEVGQRDCPSYVCICHHAASSVNVPRTSRTHTTFAMYATCTIATVEACVSLGQVHALCAQCPSYAGLYCRACMLALCNVCSRWVPPKLLAHPH